MANGNALALVLPAPLLVFDSTNGSGISRARLPAKRPSWLSCPAELHTLGTWHLTAFGALLGAFLGCLI